MMSIKKVLIADVITIIIVAALGIAAYANDWYYSLVGSIIVLGIVTTDLFYAHKFYKRMYKPYTLSPEIQQAASKD
jgi:membrane protein YdbS with pleckstrin-like domain